MRVHRLDDLRRWLFPGACALCGGAADDSLCPRCLATLPRPPHACPRCAAPLASASATVCGVCQQRPPAFDRTDALFQYAPPVDWIIHGLKYRQRLDLIRFLGRPFAEFAATRGAVPDVLVPVPLHPARLRQRGYNQSLELARYVGKRLDVEIEVRGAHRRRATLPQMELPRERRRANVRGAFAVTCNLTDRHAAIIDDVMTTGSTVDALARQLKRAGAREVSVWVVARVG